MGMVINPALLCIMFKLF